MRKIAHIAFITFLLGLCHAGLNAQDLLSKKYHKNGEVKSLILQFGNDIQVTHYYDNGQLKEKYFYSDNMRQGMFRTWHANGNIRFTGSYAKDIRTGKWQVHDSQGQVIGEAEFDDGKVVDGYLIDLNGEMIVYNE